MIWVYFKLHNVVVLCSWLYAATPLLDPFAIKVKQLPVYNILTGEKTDEMITLSNRVFGMPLREDILHRVVVWQVHVSSFLHM